MTATTYSCAVTKNKNDYKNFFLSSINFHSSSKLHFLQVIVT